jgi:uncharacterized protein (TIRG00374 family)
LRSARTRTRTLIQLAVGLSIALLALWLTYRNTDRAGLAEVLGGARWGVLLLVLPPLVLSYVFRIVRWQVLLSPIRKISFRDAASPLLAGFMVNSVFPARIGEVVRALLLSKRTGISRASSFGTVVLDRIFDGLTLTAMTLVATASLWSLLEPGVRTGLIAASAGYIAVLFCAIALRKWKHRTASALIRPLRKIGFRVLSEKLEQILISFAEGLATLQNWREVLQISLLSAGVWLSLALSVAPAFWALRMPMEWHYPILVLILAAFGMLIPTPAGTGTVHATLRFMLPALTALRPAEAAAFALVFHASQFIPIILAGVVAAISEGVRAEDVMKAEEV